MLPATIADVAVGGAGRYLVLHLPSLKRLAIFDVNAAEVVGNIPVKEDHARFAAGIEDVVVVLPGSRNIERWSLRTFQRDVATPLPIAGVIKAVAMGSGSRGPLLVHAARGTGEVDPASFILFDVERMRLSVRDVKVFPALGNAYRDIVHLRASADGRVFGMWCTSHSPSGVGVVMASELGAQSYYAHTDWGYVVPGPDGKVLYTRLGMGAPQVSLSQTDAPQGDPVLPACHGDTYLRLPPMGGQNPVRPPGGHSPPGRPPLGYGGTLSVHASNRARPIASVPDVDLPPPRDGNIPHDFTFDKRVHLISDAGLIITIPDSNDRLVLRRFGG